MAPLLRYLGALLVLSLVAVSAWFVTPQGDTTGPVAHSQVVHTDVALASNSIDSSYEDCVTAAVDISAGLAGRGIRIATTAKKIATVIGGLSQLIPGVKCGDYLGEHNVQLICWYSQRPWYVPGVLQTRAFIWMVSGGEINRCTP